MKNTKKQNSKKTAASKQRREKQQQQRLEDRLLEEFEFSCYNYVTREHLEDAGYDSAVVSDDTMKELASRLGDVMDEQYAEHLDTVSIVAQEFDIPKHPKNPSA